MTPSARNPSAAETANLATAVGRMQRSLWIWGGLFAAMGLLTLTQLRTTHPLAAVPWLLGAALLFVVRQPALLALVSVQWGLSLVVLIPGVGAAFGRDPLLAALTPAPIEAIGLSLVRVLLAVTAWNQFAFYRMLYGTAGASGLNPNLPPIPQVIPNQTDRLAWTSRLMAFGGLVAAPAAVAARSSGLSDEVLTLGLILATYAIGLGLGAVFSPTRQRSQALAGVGLGAIGFLGALAAGAFLGG